MTNINDKGVVDLGLALGSRNYSIETHSNSSTGAGGNAKSRIDVAFAASDPLAELVWSPHNGLSLKCTDSSLADKKPFPLSTSQSIKRSKGSGDDKFLYEEKLTMLQKMLKVEDKIDDEGTSFRFDLDASHMFSDAGSNDKMEEKYGNVDAIQKEENRKDNIEEDFCRSKDVQIVDIAESGKRNADVEIADIAESSKRNVDVEITDVPESSKINADDSLADRTSESKVNIVIRGTSCDHIIGSAVPIPSEPQAEKLAEAPMEIEGSAENDLAHLAAEEAKQNSRICLYRDNEKEKALSDDEDDSHASMESRNSAPLFSKGIKRQFYEQGHQIIESKRMKKQIEGNYGSTSVVRPDSSFMNWISNMVKGFSDSNKEESSSLALTIARPDKDSKIPNTGFQSVFRSLYCRDTNKDICSIEKSKELIVADERSCEGEKDNSCKQIVLSTKEVNRRTSEDIVGRSIKPWIFSSNFACTDSLSKQAKIAAENTSLNIPLPMSCVPEKSNPRASLWITRLYTRTPTVENSSKITRKSNIDSGTADILSASEKIPEKSRDSEEMASVFAKRWDALRHIIHPSKKKRKSSKCTLICFYCGRSDHDLLKCPELTETKIEDLLLKISSFDGVEEYSCFCIRCFQCDHWAISCPSHVKKPSVGYCPNELRKNTASDSENYSRGKQKFQRGILSNPQNVVADGEMFRAIRKLRLSRSDILRWTNSNTSSSHLNGFFLRLRVGKVEAGLGWTGYYVARITGYATEIVDYKLKKSILVDVGGIKSSVGSQYVSNHDFLEDEIKAWWSRIAKMGDKIPLLDELNSRVEDRISLGF